jgi:hypothetical protein
MGTPALTANIRVGKKCLFVPKPVAYMLSCKIHLIKSFISESLACNSQNLLQ